MSVSSIAQPVQYLGNGAATAFAFPYKFFANSDLVVVSTVLTTLVDTNLVLNSDFTVSGAGLDAGGTVTFFSAPAVGVMITIFRDIAKTQQVDYIAQDNFPAETHEGALDRQVSQAQDLTVIAARSLRIPRTLAPLPQMDAPNFRGKVVGFNRDMGLDSSVLLDDIRTIIIANPVDELPGVTDYGAVSDEVTAVADYGSVT